MKRATSRHRFIRTSVADKNRRVFSQRGARGAPDGTSGNVSPAGARPIEITENNTPMYFQDTNCNTTPLAQRVHGQLSTERYHKGTLPLTFKTQVHSPVPPDEVSHALVKASKLVETANGSGKPNLLELMSE